MSRYTEEKIILCTSQLHVSEHHKVLLESMLMSDSIDWNYVLERTLEEGTTGLVYKTIKGMGNNYLSKIPCADAFSTVYSETIFRNTLLFEEFKKVLDAFEGHRIPVILLRGYVMIQTIYKDPGLRPLDDIDILIRKEDVLTISDILFRSGYRSPPSYPLLFIKDGAMIDVHLDLAGSSRIQSRRFGYNEEAAQWWQHCKKFLIPPADKSFTVQDSSYEHIFVLDTHDFVITSAVHLLKHSFGRLIWFVDIKEMLEYERPHFDWKSFRGRIEFLCMQKPLYYSLKYIHVLYGVSVPPSLLEDFGKELNVFEKLIMRMLLNHKKVYRWGDIVFLFSIENLKERVKYLVETYFPRREVISQIFGISHPALIYFFYIFRFWQVIFIGSRECTRLLLQVISLFCRLRK